jgi:hypothetical protein
MISPALAAGLGPARYWWLAASIFGMGPSLMGLAYDRLVAAARLPHVKVAAGDEAPAALAGSSAAPSSSSAAPCSARSSSSPPAEAAAAAAADEKGAAAAAATSPPAAGEWLLARLDLSVLLALALAQGLCSLASVLEGFYGPWPFPVACTATTVLVLALRLARPAAYLRHRLLLLTTVRTVCSCFALFNAVLWTLGMRPAEVYGSPGIMAVSGASVAVLLKIACMRVHVLAHVVLQVGGLGGRQRCAACCLLASLDLLVQGDASRQQRPPWLTG